MDRDLATMAGRGGQNYNKPGRGIRGAGGRVLDEITAAAGLLGRGGWLGLGAGLAMAIGVGAAARRPDLVVSRPRSVLALLALATLAAGLSLFRLDPPGLHLAIDPSTEPLLPAGDPAQDLYRSAVLDFGDDEVYVVAIECPEVFSEACLSAMDRVTAQVVLLPGVRTVKSLVDVTSFRWVEEEEWVEVRPFIEDVPSDPAALADLKRRGLVDPMYRKTLVSEDSRAAAINLTFRKMNDAEFIGSQLDARIHEVVAREVEDGYRFHLAGRPHVKVRVYEGMLRDLGLLIPVSIALMGVVLFVVTGAVRGVVLPLGTAILANLWTFGLMAAADVALTILTGLLGPMLLAVGSLYGVHVMARYEEEAAREVDVQTTVLDTLRHLIVPMLIAGLTTMVGFGALLITDVPAVFELGLFSMFGIGAATTIALTGIPATLALLPLRSAHAVGRGASGPARMANAVAGRLDRVLGASAAAVRRSQTPILAVAAIAAVVAAALIPRISIDTDYLSYFDERDPVRLEFEAVNRLLAGAIPIYVVLDGTGPGTFRDPALLRQIETLQARIDEVPGVSRSVSFLDTLKMLNRAFHADDPAEQRIPETRGGTTELLFMMPKSDLQKFTTVNHGRANIVVRTGEVGSEAILRLTKDIEDVIARTPLPGGVEARVTGNAILLARSADGIARGQPVSVALATLAIFTLITWGMRSVKLGLVAMIPNLLPVMVFFGMLGLGVAPLSLPTSLIGCVALGIAIDDTAHFLARYSAERKRGVPPDEAAERSMRSVGRPIAITSVMLVLGFNVVAFSEFATLREFGTLSAFTMMICLLTDLVLLPAVLIRGRV